MKKIYILLLTLTISSWSFGQVINEVDADTPGSDAAEFIEIKQIQLKPFVKEKRFQF